MKLSLFTPTNNPEHLIDCHNSLRYQGHDNLEWLIMVNGGAKPEDIPRQIVSDSRVRVVKGPATSNIGGLKRAACEACSGDAFIEFDHDDLLVPGTLSHVAATFNRGYGFVYSDVAVFDDGKRRSWGYHPSFGWRHYPLRVYGRPFVVTQCFPVTPRMLCEVYFAPDHVRAWSKEAYEKVGGHDASLSVCDDHDLVCRTYKEGIPFGHIGRCGYLYRYHRGNTVKARQKKIVDQSAANRGKYLTDLTLQWCKEHSYPIDDVLPRVKSGKWAVDTPYTPESTPLGYIKAWDVLQYVPPHRQVDFFNRAYEALVPGGYLSITVPSESGRYATQDPRHLTRFNINSFYYYTEHDFAKNNPDIKCRFQLIHWNEFYPSEFFKKHDMKMLRVELVALKGQHHPGPQRI